MESATLEAFLTRIARAGPWLYVLLHLSLSLMSVIQDTVP